MFKCSSLLDRSLVGCKINFKNFKKSVNLFKKNQTHSMFKKEDPIWPLWKYLYEKGNALDKKLGKEMFKRTK